MSEMAEVKQALRDLQKDLKDYAKSTERNSTDIVWLKRGMIGAFATFFTMAATYFMDKIGG